MINDSQIALRAPKPLIRQLDRVAKTERRSRSQMLRLILEQSLSQYKTQPQHEVKNER